MADELRWICDEVVLRIHAEQIVEHGGSDGIRDGGLLSSALARARHIHAYESTASIAQLAAAFAMGIVKNHPFIDGNKRTGAVVAESFIRLNGFWLDASDDEWCDVVLEVAAGEMADTRLTEWLSHRIRPNETS